MAPTPKPPKTPVKKVSKAQSSQDPIQKLPYKKIRQLGKGGFGVVDLMKRTTSPKEKFAVKIQQIGKRTNKIKEEFNIHKELEHESIIKVFELIQFENQYFMVMEYANKGVLWDLIPKDDVLEVELAQKLFKQLIAGIKYLHSQGIVHRDIKPDNLLIFKEEILKICDFGSAKKYLNGDQEILFSTGAGSKSFNAPEIFSEDEFRGPPLDIWAAGLVLVCMLVNSQPWERATPGDKGYSAWKRGKLFNEWPWTEVDPMAMSLISWILMEDLNRRYTIEQIEQSDWLQMAPAIPTTEIPTLKNLPGLAYLPYHHIRELRSGTYGHVHLMKSTHNPENLMALKIIPRRRGVQNVQDEYYINRKLMSNEFIIKVFGMSNHSGNCYLTLEYADGGDLLEVMPRRKPVSPELGHHFFKQLLAGIKYMHSQGVVHRDLKPDNLLVFKERATLKIADFGNARHFRYNGNEVWFAEKKYGTRMYMAPEAYTAIRYRGPPTDVFACGLVLVVVLTRINLWERAEIKDPSYAKWVAGGSPDGENWNNLDPRVVDLIRLMLLESPYFRHTIDNIENSEWMQMERDQKKLWSQIEEMKDNVKEKAKKKEEKNEEVC
ncbi:hypothetical protein B9Z55_008136 [Caenorhabditis nigoni]|uniref:Protein kinase domain-containing protein n=2 Tax=Caenorhabditis nigoni TaxID=1611254 RepID=A0A2G5VCT4_9PELO|nr:hypothetical protein B9Z55_008136 [Caenorhabditis nigoni]